MVDLALKINAYSDIYIIINQVHNIDDGCGQKHCGSTANTYLC